MKNIKKITLLFCLMSTVTFANTEKGGIRFFERNNTTQKADDTDDPNYPTADQDPTPIDDYLPLLVIGAGLVALRFRKQLLKN
ncbi:hypothetical protein NZD85_13580 [Empedobacter stercoris]|uniref:hypothetical protein n=1 Tax=Empedobacter stercoris TaxID=1628248 RepID=UPI0021B03A62|nr:hypothetical protein [Empedobacter stercoris]UWX66880.1 hypothetical protein NZD85_13580 [Empedobacter stercoris]